MTAAVLESRPETENAPSETMLSAPNVWSPPGFTVRTASPELLEEIAGASRTLERASPEDILTWAVDNYYPRFTMATGLGPEGCVIISMLAKIEPRVYIFNLDTGYQFPETLELRDRIAEKYGIIVDLQKPDLSRG